MTEEFNEEKECDLPEGTRNIKTSGQKVKNYCSTRDLCRRKEQNEKKRNCWSQIQLKKWVASTKTCCDNQEPAIEPTLRSDRNQSDLRRYITKIQENDYTNDYLTDGAETKREKKSETAQTTGW